MHFILTGESTNATVSCGAGFTETWVDGGEGIGVMFETGPGFGVSTRTSTSSSGGGSMSSGGSSSCCSSIGASSSISAIVTSTISLLLPLAIVSTAVIVTKRTTKTSAQIGAV